MSTYKSKTIIRPEMTEIRGAISRVARVASATLDFGRGPSFTGVTCNLSDLVIDYFIEKCV